ncbi:hypothetical protein PQBR44_0161 (plasmid) [Pseudomonas putida UWC1]|nr:hypothetical protein PQBR44_0161 [Pseudomonas putida UWC1]
MQVCLEHTDLEFSNRASILAIVAGESWSNPDCSNDSNRSMADRPDVDFE